MTITAFTYVKLFVRDVETLARFYCDTLGLKRVRRYDVGEGADALIEIFLSVGNQVGGVELALMQYLNRPAPTLGEAALAFTVKDLDTSVAAVLSAGGAVDMAARTIEDYNLRVASVTDPEGHIVELMQFLA